MVQLDELDLAGWIGACRAEAALAAVQLEETDEQLMADIIAEETAAYIEEKAAAMGVKCRALVICRQAEEGFPLPASVTVLGGLTEAQRRMLSGVIAADLAIPAERQYFDGEGATDE